MIRQSFLYGYNIDDTNFQFNFREAGDVTDRVFNIPFGSYTPQELETEVLDQLNGLGDEVYTVTYDVDARTFLISATGVFELYPTSSPVSALPLLGFTVDLTGLDNYTGDQTGTLYEPQLPLFNLSLFENEDREVNGSTTITTSGLEQATTLGIIPHMSCDIRYITDRDTGRSPLENNPNATSEAKAFIRNAIKKNVIIFFKDKTDNNTFNKCLLAKTQQSSDGLGFKLNEMRTENLPGFFELRGLEFREIS